MLMRNKHRLIYSISILESVIGAKICVTYLVLQCSRNRQRTVFLAFDIYLSTLQEENFHWNLRFAISLNGKFAKILLIITFLRISQ